ncbi:MAG: hypothetical protein U0236_19960 [Nitrospira sp.]
MLPSHTGTAARLMMYCAMVGTSFSPIFSPMSLAEEPSEPKSIRMTCGKCPEGYATTGVTLSQDICKDSDGTLVQCVPLGANMLGVCGVCPEGYAEIGSSSVPARCGNGEGGRLTQCQLRKMETTFPDATQGYKTCPPDCGSTAQPGQGAIPPPPRYQQVPDQK